MNGIHDMGGMHGFGKVGVEPDEPVFHEPWQARVFGIIQSLGGGNIDAGRHSIERLDPVSYLRNGYYGRWFAALERGLVGAGVLAQADIDSRMTSASAATQAVPGRSPAWRPATPNYIRKVEALPKFAAGQRVVTRNHQPATHTRLPAYGRCRRGVIVRVHPAMVYPDDNSLHRGENPQYLYTVRFEGAELWGDTAEPNTVVHIDLFEPYLETEA
jgi:nitrile hydratase subunit beta